jgi:hypothetical protein
VACDFFTVETVFLKTLYVLVFLHIGTRRILGVGVSANPNGTWVTQQARNVVMDLDHAGEPCMGFLLRDRDAKYCRSFDDVFDAEGIEVVLTPYRTPQANAHVERLIGGLRREILDHVLILHPDTCRSSWVSTPRITTRIDRIAGSVFAVRTTSRGRYRARTGAARGDHASRDPRWADPRIPCPRGMNEPP